MAVFAKLLPTKLFLSVWIKQQNFKKNIGKIIPTFLETFYTTFSHILIYKTPTLYSWFLNLPFLMYMFLYVFFCMSFCMSFCIEN